MQLGDASGRVLFLEEKTNGGVVHEGQKNVFRMLSGLLEGRHGEDIYFGGWGFKRLDYWGFYVLSFPKGIDMPGPGMLLNGKAVTCEQLQRHLSFEEKICSGCYPATARLLATSKAS